MNTGSEFWTSLTSIALAIVGVAILAVVLSNNSNTVGVVTASAQAFTSGLATALTPITGLGSSSSFPIG